MNVQSEERKQYEDDEQDWAKHARDRVGNCLPIGNGGHGDGVVVVLVGVCPRQRVSLSSYRIMLVRSQCTQSFINAGGSKHHMPVARIELYCLGIEQWQKEVQAQAGEEKQFDSRHPDAT